MMKDVVIGFQLVDRFDFSGFFFFASFHAIIILLSFCGCNKNGRDQEITNKETLHIFCKKQKNSSKKEPNNQPIIDLETERNLIATMNQTLLARQSSVLSTT